jgi:hypothetical protein
MSKFNFFAQTVFDLQGGICGARAGHLVATCIVSQCTHFPLGCTIPATMKGLMMLLFFKYSLSLLRFFRFMSRSDLIHSKFITYA